MTWRKGMSVRKRHHHYYLLLMLQAVELVETSHWCTLIGDVVKKKYQEYGHTQCGHFYGGKEQFHCQCKLPFVTAKLTQYWKEKFTFFLVFHWWFHIIMCTIQFLCVCVCVCVCVANITITFYDSSYVCNTRFTCWRWKRWKSHHSYKQKWHFFSPS